MKAWLYESDEHSFEEILDPEYFSGSKIKVGDCVFIKVGEEKRLVEVKEIIVKENEKDEFILIKYGEVVK